MRRLAARAAIAFASTWMTAAGAADEGDALLDAPAPPTLPALAHRELTYTFEYTAASIETNAGSRAYAWFAHNELEYPVEPREWYLGVASDMAAGAVPGVGSAVLAGNPELWARGVWSNLLGLSAGGAMGFVLPVPRDLSVAQAEVLRTVRVVRPWDVAYFDDLTLTARPSYDIRHVTGRWIFQLRQGMDVSIAFRELTNRERRMKLTARATFYLGFRAAEAVGLGLELFEVYQLTGRDVPDDRRAAFAVSPSVRFLLTYVEPAISALFPVATPLRGDVESYFGARVNVGFKWDVAR